MGINLATIKQELREIEEKIKELQTKKTALESLKGAYSLKTVKNTGSTRSIDIMPYINQIFEKNSNQLIRKKELVAEVEKLSGLPKNIIEGKLFPIMRKGFIESPEGQYGKYHLKN